jgi:hypothetical protein
MIEIGLSLTLLDYKTSVNTFSHFYYYYYLAGFDWIGKCLEIVIISEKEFLY